MCGVCGSDPCACCPWCHFDMCQCVTCPRCGEPDPQNGEHVCGTEDGVSHAPGAAETGGKAY